MKSTSYDDQFTRGDSYISPSKHLGLMSRLFPSPMFYLRSLLGPVLHLSILAQIGKCDDSAWVLNSARVARMLESVGCRFRIEGMEHISALDEPCVFVGNHMSTLETFVLPSIVQPRKPVTFVVKKSLTTMPLFGPVLRSRNPVVVGRSNARQDLTTVLEEGKKRLDEGKSVIVFPQSTRALVFDPAKFNSIGVKLAKHAQKPIIPLALQTQAWGQGKKIKDFGEVYPEKTIHFRFGAPITVQGQGKGEQAYLCEFISNALEEWAKA